MVFASNAALTRELLTPQWRALVGAIRQLRSVSIGDGYATVEFSNEERNPEQLEKAMHIVMAVAMKGRAT